MKQYVPRHAVVQPLDPSIRLIPLTQNKNAIVDADLYDWLNQWNWFAVFDRDTNVWYAGRWESRHKGHAYISMHGAVLAVAKGVCVDHINRDGLDNRRSNLRVATKSQNAVNSKLRRTNTTGYTGVYRYQQNRWMAKIIVNRKQVHLGFFSIKEDAALAYNEAAKKYHGEFARLNIIPD